MTLSHWSSLPTFRRCRIKQCPMPCVNQKKFTYKYECLSFDPTTYRTEALRGIQHSSVDRRRYLLAELGVRRAIQDGADDRHPPQQMLRRVEALQLREVLQQYVSQVDDQPHEANQRCVARLLITGTLRTHTHTQTHTGTQRRWIIRQCPTLYLPLISAWVSKVW